MPTKSKNGSSTKPVLDFEFVEYRESDRYTIDERVLSMLEQYPLYVEAVSGKRPTKDQVVEKALRRVLSQDQGFQKFLKDSAAEAKPKPGSGQESKADPKPDVKANRSPQTPEKSTEVLRT